MVLPLGAESPPLTLWCWTRSNTGPKRPASFLTVKPRSVRAFSASLDARPTTLGTCTMTGPLETTSLTASPRCSVPWSGDCETTCPDGTVSLLTSGARSTTSPAFVTAADAASNEVPVTVGTSIGWRPLETTTATLEPRLTEVPGAGSCETTAPAGTVSLQAREVSPSRSVNGDSAAPRSPSLVPTSWGTAYRSLPLDTTRRTVDCLPSSVP